MRLNQLTGRWVTIVAERANRPTAFAPRMPFDQLDDPSVCPFCPGNEEATPPVLQTFDSGGDWTIRVIPNRYPAFAGDGGFAVHHEGPIHVMAEGTGLHEVFVYTPEHDLSLDRLDDEQMASFMVAIKSRMNHHAGVPNVRYTQAIVNHGREAGASIAHPHGQLLGLPFVPGEVLDEERAFARFAGGCLLCTTAEAELTTGERVVSADDDVVTIAPYWSGVPYELLILPRQHELHFHDSSDEALAAVGRALRDATLFLNRTLGDVAYNVGIHTAPYAHTGEYHWHIHVWPNLVTQAGFERGTGVMINIVPPEDAAETLRSASTLTKS